MLNANNFFKQKTWKMRKKHCQLITLSVFFKLYLTWPATCLAEEAQKAARADSVSQAAQSRCTVVRPMQKSIGKWEIQPPVKS